MRATIVIVCALAATGCLFPDRSKLGRDGGVDAGDAGGDGGHEEDAGDGGTDDAGDGCVVAEQHERSCENDRDDDCDGLTDCNDFDCGRALVCCGEGGDATTSEFMTSAYWTSLPTGATPVIAPADDVISIFPSSEPRAIRYDECLPVDLGIAVRAVMRARGPSCAAGTSCHASLVLTPQSDMARGIPLADELSIRVYADGFVEARRAGTLLARSPRTLGAGPLDVEVKLTPGIDDAGNAWVYTEVTVSGSEPWQPWTGLRALIPRGDLVGAGLGCEQARGLYLALEGIGDRVEIQSVTIDPFECANPSHFEIPPGGVTEIAIEDVGATERWSSGGIGAPALASYFVDGAPPETWTLLYDATNVPRTNELSAPVRFAVGLSQTTRGGGLSDWTVVGDPLIGADPPHCAGCMPSVREPTIHLPIDEETRGLPAVSFGWAVYARELEDSGGRRFRLEARQITTAPIGASSTAYPLLTPASEGSGCTSLRDPLLLPMHAGDATEAWLLYSCARGASPREIRIARFTADGGAPRATPLDVALLTAADVGPIASIALHAADGAAWFVGDDLVIHRLWLATRDISGRTAIAFAESSGVPGEMPSFVPYAANPVLRAEDPVLGRCDAADCDIDSVAVTRIANSPHRVRLLVARTITTATEVRHVLVPLDQIWPEPQL
ncbi:MAG: hypothetical protein M3Y87_23630 [Myxococcota bacterium]|nr:hypothetical protein [Myxococcota bacterium]